MPLSLASALHHLWRHSILPSWVLMCSYRRSLPRVCECVFESHGTLQDRWESVRGGQALNRKNWFSFRPLPPEIQHSLPTNPITGITDRLVVLQRSSSPYPPITSQMLPADDGCQKTMSAVFPGLFHNDGAYLTDWYLYEKDQTAHALQPISEILILTLSQSWLTS